MVVRKGLLDQFAVYGRIIRYQDLQLGGDGSIPWLAFSPASLRYDTSFCQPSPTVGRRLFDTLLRSPCICGSTSQYHLWFRSHSIALGNS